MRNDVNDDVDFAQFAFGKLNSQQLAERFRGQHIHTQPRHKDTENHRSPSRPARRALDKHAEEQRHK
ncbi:hypothetical protein D3C75_1245600 [compost metagenome]